MKGADKVKLIGSLISSVALGMVAVSLAACSASQVGQPSVPPSPELSAATRARGQSAEAYRTHAELFVSDFDHDNVDVYAASAKHTLLAHVSDFGLVGAAVDSKANLYVAGTIASNSGGVQVFAPPYSGDPSEILNLPDYVTGVAVGENGQVAVPLVQRGSAPSSLVLFPPNASSACAVLSNSAFYSIVDDLAFDSKGDLYLVGFDQSRTVHVGEVKGGCKATGIDDIGISGLKNPGGLQIDKNRNIDISTTEADGSVGINIYSPKSHAELDSLSMQGAVGSGGFAFASSGEKFWFGPAGGNGWSVSEYHFPGGGKPISSILIGSSAQPLQMTFYPPRWTK